MAKFRVIAAAILLLSAAGCSFEPSYRLVSRASLGLQDEPFADHILISKSRRKLYLISNSKAFRSYDISLGFAPVGPKRREGDGRTPEGTYLIDRRNPRSAFHLSLGISYPNAADRAAARRRGVDPGGDIFVHGRPKRNADPDSPDWTAGCISVTDREIEEIWVLVRDGTPITIRP